MTQNIVLLERLDVSRAAHVVRLGAMNARKGRCLHLHDQGFVPFLALFGLSAVNVHEDAGDDVTKGREYGKCVAPTNVIVVWIQ